MSPRYPFSTRSTASIRGHPLVIPLPRARTMGIAWAHALGNVIALALILANCRLRYGAPDDPAMLYGLF
jgi:hypothetical protein